ncbi:MAG: mechanosensitive ion channel family protein [Corynebacterium sp.]|nr:mechanosensitive ion channel family protein [Corynebacterium sp.]
MIAAPALALASVPTSGEDIEAWWHNENAREWLIDRPLSIVLTLIAAVILQWLLNKAINKLTQLQLAKPSNRVSSLWRTNNDAASAALTHTQQQRRESRIHTLQSVGHSAVAIFVWVWATLSILETLGVNVTPLIASAGVVGVALGFGAQSLVKDFLSGIFMLIEDQYGVGDTIEVGSVVGTVEDVSMRVTTLRDVHGTVWFIRNGEILQVGNFSQEYAVALMDFPLPQSLGAETAITRIRNAANEAVATPALQDLILESPRIDGVQEITSDTMTIRVRITTMPGKQWQVEREVTAKILEALQDAATSTVSDAAIGGTADASAATTN